LQERIILSLEQEQSTNLVIQYLHYFKGKYSRLHKEDILTGIDIKISNHIEGDLLILNTKGGQSIIASYLTKMWYRKGDFSIEIPANLKILDQKVSKYLLQEWEYVKKFLHNYLSNIGNYYHEQEDSKLKDLCLARDCGLMIPNTLVTTRKSALIEFFRKYERIISKPIHNGHLWYSDKSLTYFSKGILEVNSDIISKAGESFCLSLFQEYIEKEFEIRAFFIDNELYPMAIFSQSDEKTKLDYRNYNRTKPNRNIPFKFPDSIKTKLLDFNSSVINYAAILPLSSTS